MMIPDESAFIRAITDHPDDDLPRLVYADWLDERGDPRGEFIRVQCELAEMLARHRRDCVGMITGDVESAALRRLNRELLHAHGMAWLGSAPLREDAHPLAWTDGDGTLRPVRLVFSPEWRRGFVGVVTCTWEDWVRHSAALLAACPIRNAAGGLVRLTTWPDDLIVWDDRVLILSRREPMPPGSTRVRPGNEQHVRALLAAEWPGVDIRLPAAPRVFPYDPDDPASLARAEAAAAAWNSGVTIPAGSVRRVAGWRRRAGV